MLKRVVISLTDRCNLKCRHCYNGDNFSRSLNQLDYINETFSNDLKELGVQHIGLTGGEPLLVWDKLLEVTSVLKKNKFSILLTTNGLLLNKEKMDILIDKGINWIQVSIDGIDKEKHEFIRGNNTFNKIIKLFGDIDYSKYNIIPMYTINKNNYMDIEKFIKMMTQMNVKRIGFERYIPVTTRYKEQLELTKEMLIEAYRVINKYDNMGNIEIHINDPLYNIYKLEEIKLNSDIIKNMKNWNIGCSALRTSIYIDSQGNVLPCTFTNRSVFNVNKFNIKKVSNYLLNSDYIESIKCRECKYALLCRGCRASALYSNSKKWEGDDPLCLLT